MYIMFFLSICISKKMKKTILCISAVLETPFFKNIFKMQKICLYFSLKIFQKMSFNAIFVFLLLSRPYPGHLMSNFGVLLLILSVKIRRNSTLKSVSKVSAEETENHSVHFCPKLS